MLIKVQTAMIPDRNSKYKNVLKPAPSPHTLRVSSAHRCPIAILVHIPQQGRVGWAPAALKRCRMCVPDSVGKYQAVECADRRRLDLNRASKPRGPGHASEFVCMSCSQTDRPAEASACIYTPLPKLCSSHGSPVPSSHILQTIITMRVIITGVTGVGPSSLLFTHHVMPRGS